jgi:hypothetical protein
MCVIHGICLHGPSACHFMLVLETTIISYSASLHSAKVWHMTACRLTFFAPPRVYSCSLPNQLLPCRSSSAFHHLNPFGLFGAHCCPCP